MRRNGCRLSLLSQRDKWRGGAYSGIRFAKDLDRARIEYIKTRPFAYARFKKNAEMNALQASRAVI